MPKCKHPKQGKSWEEDIPEHQQRTFKDIKQLTEANIPLATPGKRPEEPSITSSPSPHAIKYQEWRKIVEHKEIEE